MQNFYVNIHSKNITAACNLSDAIILSLPKLFTYAHLALISLSEDIQWPDEEEWQVRDDAKDLILGLLQHDPLHRLGTAGAQEVKEHIFFLALNWDDLLRQKAEFVPQLDNEEDTSYFDSEIATNIMLLV